MAVSIKQTPKTQGNVENGTRFKNTTVHVLLEKTIKKVWKVTYFVITCRKVAQVTWYEAELEETIVVNSFFLEITKTFLTFAKFPK